MTPLGNSIKKENLELDINRLSISNTSQDKKLETKPKDKKKKKKVKFKDLMSSIVKSDTRTDKEIFESNQEKIRQSCGDGAGKSLNFSKLEKL